MVIVLRRVERLQGNHLRYDSFPENPGTFGRTYVLLGDTFLVLVGVKNRRAVLATMVRALVVQLSRVVGHGKENLKQLPIADY